MHKVSLIAFILATTTLAACSRSTPPHDPEPITETPAPVEVTDTIDTTESPSDTTNTTVNLKESILQREASKKLITNYYHRGTVAFSNASIDTDDQGRRTGLDATIDMTTIAYSEGKGAGVIGHITSADLFDVEVYPTAQLVSTSITPTDTGYDIQADLTIKDQTHPITFSFVQQEDNTYITSFDIDRTKRGITYGSDNFFDNLGNNVINDTISYEATIVTTTEKEQCESQPNHKRLPQGKAQIPACITLYSDGGTACTSSDQCEGNCIKTATDTPATCERDNSQFGCKTTIERFNDGEGILCVD